MECDGEMAIYMDGGAAGTKDMSSYAAIAVDAFYIGRWARSGSPGYFDWMIDDLRVYDRVLFAWEIEALHDTGN